MVLCTRYFKNYSIIVIVKGYNNMDISSIITSTKKDFTRERASVINDFLNTNTNSVILSYIKKARGDSIKFYYLKNGKKCTSDYVTKNARVLIDAFLKNGIKLYQYNNGTITEYKKD